MCLVDDEGVIGFEQWVGLRFGKQNPICHQLDGSAGADAIVKAHLVAHYLAQRGFQFFSYACGHAAGRYAARLGVAYEFAPLPRLRRLRRTPQGQCHFWQLRGFARACFAADNDDLMRRQRRLNFCAPG